MKKIVMVGKLQKIKTKDEVREINIEPTYLETFMEKQFWGGSLEKRIRDYKDRKLFD